MHIHININTQAWGDSERAFEKTRVLYMIESYNKDMYVDSLNLCTYINNTQAWGSSECAFEKAHIGHDIVVQ
jgi:hypothetical protein